MISYGSRRTMSLLPSDTVSRSTSAASSRFSTDGVSLSPGSMPRAMTSSAARRCCCRCGSRKHGKHMAPYPKPRHLPLWNSDVPFSIGCCHSRLISNGKTEGRDDSLLNGTIILFVRQSWKAFVLVTTLTVADNGRRRCERAGWTDDTGRGSTTYSFSRFSCILLAPCSRMPCATT